jgi:prepilin-type N-terminal cleavage/methylation domain-containing protein
MRHGLTLVEILLVILITGLLALFALPGLMRLRDHLAVAEMAALVEAAHARARLVAVAEQRVAVLTLTADSVVVRVVEAPGDTALRWRARGPADRQVDSRGFPRAISFAPSGVAFGFANGTYEFTRGSATRRVIVSRYGRVRQE